MVLSSRTSFIEINNARLEGCKSNQISPQRRKRCKVFFYLCALAPSPFVVVTPFRHNCYLWQLMLPVVLDYHPLYCFFEIKLECAGSAP